MSNPSRFSTCNFSNLDCPTKTWSVAFLPRGDSAKGLRVNSASDSSSGSGGGVLLPLHLNFRPEREPSSPREPKRFATRRLRNPCCSQWKIPAKSSLWKSPRITRITRKQWAEMFSGFAGGSPCGGMSLARKQISRNAEKPQTKRSVGLRPAAVRQWGPASPVRLLVRP